MTDDEITALTERLWGYGTEDSVAAVAAIRQLMGERTQYHPIGYWDWHTGAFHTPDKLTPAQKKMLELGRLRTCYVKYESTKMPPRPVHVGIKPPGQS